MFIQIPRRTRLDKRFLFAHFLGYSLDRSAPGEDDKRSKKNKHCNDERFSPFDRHSVSFYFVYHCVISFFIFSSSSMLLSSSVVLPRYLPHLHQHEPFSSLGTTHLLHPYWQKRFFFSTLLSYPCTVKSRTGRRFSVVYNGNNYFIRRITLGPIFGSHGDYIVMFSHGDIGHEITGRGRKCKNIRIYPRLCAVFDLVGY